MENLFNYATKELSQDAFLRWLFANHNAPDLQEAVYCLLKEFCKFSDDERVVDLTSQPQWRKIDVAVWITTDRGRKIALFIEDKTFSDEHNQLKTYNDKIKRVTDRTPFKIFYKTSVVEERERKAVEDAQWELYDIDRIVPLFEKYAQSPNFILRQYAEHIKASHEAIHSTSKPKDSNCWNDWLQWTSFFNKAIIEKIKPHHDDLIFWVIRAGQYPYICLCMKKAGIAPDIPYLEIRSRDCTDGNFAARFLCYGVKEEDLRRNQQKLIDKIKHDGVMECKHLVRHKKGRDIFPKQIGCTKEGLRAETEEAFLQLVEEQAAYYMQVMSLWE